MRTNEVQEGTGKMPGIGFVIIGRNEGDRLKRCIESILEQSYLMQRQADSENINAGKQETGYTPYPIVYVDSGSTDGSIEYARSAGCETVELAGDIAFTAARARNSGLEHLVKRHPLVEWVQFVDGDCALQPGWLNKAATFLSVNPQAAIVCGRRREVYPQQTVYNALCDMEWDTPIGEAKSCGGDFLARRTALQSVNAFNPSMIAGEEPELCFRLRKANWTIWRIAEDMTTHDAAISSFRQFWIRNKRAGHAYAERCALHATRSRPYCVREIASICIWAFIVPCLAILSASIVPELSLLLILLYPVMMLRIFLRKIKERNSVRRSAIYSLFTQFAKFAQFIGVVKFATAQLAGRRSFIIEYK